MDSCFILVRTHQHGIAVGPLTTRKVVLRSPLLPRRICIPLSASSGSCWLGTARPSSHGMRMGRWISIFARVIWLCACVRYCRPRGWCLSVSFAFFVFHPSKALFSRASGNLQMHCFLGLGALFCCSFFCSRSTMYEIANGEGRSVFRGVVFPSPPP